MKPQNQNPPEPQAAPSLQLFEQTESFYQTPDWLAGLMLSIALKNGALDEPIKNKRTIFALEPSAGLGALSRKIKDYLDSIYSASSVRNYVIDMVEIYAARAERLRLQRMGDVFNTDFMSWDKRRLYNIVLMNPPVGTPARPLAYIDHIERAFSMLAPGGSLVSVIPGGAAVSNQSQKSAKFLELIKTHGIGFAESNNRPWYLLPEQTFKDVGITYPTVLVCLTK